MKSVYIIKPDGVLHREKIRAMIVSAGLNIVASKTVYLDPDALYTLYPDAPLNILIFIMGEEMLNGRCEIGIVEGDNAIERLVELCGEKVNPFECRTGTIRYAFKDHSTETRVNDYTYYRNTIHRSKNETEVQRDLELYERL